MMFSFRLWCPQWRFHITTCLNTPFHEVPGMLPKTICLRFLGGACIWGWTGVPGRDPVANIGVIGSCLNWTRRMDHLLCCWQEKGGQGPSASCDESLALDDGQTFSVTHVGTCWIPCEHFVFLSIKDPRLWHPIKGLCPPWTLKRTVVYCQLALIWLQVGENSTSFCFLAWPCHYTTVVNCHVTEKWHVGLSFGSCLLIQHEWLLFWRNTEYVIAAVC